MNPAIVVAYLNRPTRDGRVITSLYLDGGPWPIIDKSGCAIGRVTALETTRGAVFATGYEFDDQTPDWIPDWDLWCLTLSLAPTECTSSGSTIRMSGLIVGFQLSPAAHWPWSPVANLDQSAVVTRTLRTIAEWPLASMDRDEFLALADAVERLDPDDMTCPICEEAVCDDGCPLEGLRR